MKNSMIYIIAALALISCKTTVKEVRTSPLAADSTTVERHEDYYSPGRLKYSDEVYDDNIKSVQLSTSEWVFGPPVVFTGKDNQLLLSFDDLSDHVRDFHYTFILCDALWNPVDLPQMDYLEGFFEDRISTYTFSRNTLLDYIHYSLTLPGENMKPKTSGNYLLHVWCEEGGEQQTIITRRFFVADNKLGISMDVKMATDIEQRNYQHEVDFTINKSGTEIVDPYRNLTVIVQQNGRTDNMITDLKPKLVKGDELEYNYERENVFDACNEFRHFDAKSITYNTDRIASIQRKDNMVHVYLKTDYRRPFERYVSDDDINGRFLIKNDDDKDSDTESEYLWVHFFLAYDAPLTEGSVFLQGAFTQWGFGESYKMKYDYTAKGYTDSLLLKQGYYNYQYVYLVDGQSSADAAYIEGRHAEADNDYTVYVYYREPGDVKDQLIGIQIVNSGK